MALHLGGQVVGRAQVGVGVDEGLQDRSTGGGVCPPRPGSAP